MYTGRGSGTAGSFLPGILFGLRRRICVLLAGDFVYHLQAYPLDYDEAGKLLFSVVYAFYYIAFVPFILKLFQGRTAENN